MFIKVVHSDINYAPTYRGNEALVHFFCGFLFFKKCVCGRGRVPDSM